MESLLSEKERELVAVGAAVAAGCVPCTRYHLEAVHAAGAGAAEVAAAIDAAVAVARESLATMRAAAAGATDAVACGADTAQPEPAGDRLAALVAIAAAVAVGCAPSVRRHVRSGRALGARDDEIRLVVGFARMIRARAAHGVDEALAELVAESTPAAAATCCGAGPCV